MDLVSAVTESGMRETPARRDWSRIVGKVADVWRHTPASLRGNGFSRVDAALSSRLGDGTLRAGGFSVGRIFSPGGNDSSDEPVRHASRSTVLRRSIAVQSRALHAGGKSAASEVHIFPVWRGSAAVHWRIVRMVGVDPAAGDAGAEVEAEFGAWTSCGTGAADHAAPEIWNEDDDRRTLTKVHFPQRHARKN